MGKAYANRKSVEKRPLADFYPTPGFLVKKLIEDQAFKSILEDCKETAAKEKRKISILEPACGSGAISKILENLSLPVELICHDIQTDGVDFLKYTPEQSIDLVVTNPPFSLFDSFVERAKEISPRVIFIGKTNFFGAYKRNEKGVWNNLKEVLIFNRQVDYRSESREDGKFYCGNLITGWFIWDRNWEELFWKTRIMDIQDGVIKKCDPSTQVVDNMQ